MPEFFIEDYDTPKIVGDLLERGGEMPFEMEPVMEAIFFEMLEANRVQIDSGGRRAGGSYANLRPATVDKKGGADILRTEGARPGYTLFGHDTLVRSVTEEGAPEQHKIVTNDRVELGTTRPYAATHQYGWPDRHIPRRPFLLITPGDEEKYNNMIARRLMEPFMEK